LDFREQVRVDEIKRDIKAIKEVFGFDCERTPISTNNDDFLITVGYFLARR